MKLIFLHGLGQDERSWEQVEQFLIDFPRESYRIFPKGVENYVAAKHVLLEKLERESEPFLLVGLSLGAILALDVSQSRFPLMKGLVLSGMPHQLAGNWMFKLQTMLFSFVPKALFAKQGLDKDLMLEVSRNLKEFLPLEIAANCQLPTLLIYGESDKVNLKSMEILKNQMPQAKTQLVREGNHVLNTHKPEEFARAIREFLGDFTE